jgi:hypothetical protein
MTDIVTASVKALVRNFVASFTSTSTELQLGATVHGALGVAGIHGDYFEANFRGKVYSANVTAVTIPAIANNLVSVFTLYNPVGSGIIMEMLRTTLGQVLATTVVDAVGWYSSTPSATALGTFTTLGTARSGRVQNAVSGSGKFYSAFTHSGTPSREDIIGSFGATTDAGLALADKMYRGELLLDEGVAMSVAMSTAAGTTSGLDVQATWAEWPKA